MFLDSSAQLALLTKLKLAFEKPTTFLAFPLLAPTEFDADKLLFQGPASDLPTLFTFSRLVDGVPNDVLYPMGDEASLSTLYQNLLIGPNAAEVAETTATEADTKAFEAAKAVLNTESADGTWHDSVVYGAYKQHRDAWFLAQEEYSAAQATAAGLIDPAALETWKIVTEPALRERVGEAASAWATAGNRSAVEAAQLVIKTIGEKSPVLQWGRWGSAMDENLDQLTDPATQESIYPAAFSPWDVTDNGVWPSITLRGDEVMRLAAQAPEELKQRISSDIFATARVERITFEFRSVVVNRPWMDPTLFESRFWRLPDSQQPLHDGKSPPGGRCPTYITAVVFARNISVTTRNSSAGTFDELKLVKLPKFALRPPFKLKPPSPPPKPPGGPSPMFVRDHHGGAGTTFSRTLARLAGRSFGQRFASPRPGGAATPTATTTPTPTTAATGPTTTTTSRPENTVSIVAFVCKRLSKCPDPDPALKWST